LASATAHRADHQINGALDSGSFSFFRRILTGECDGLLKAIALAHAICFLPTDLENASLVQA
jgi:hypothetical protein